MTDGSALRDDRWLGFAPPGWMVASNLRLCGINDRNDSASRRGAID